MAAGFDNFIDKCRALTVNSKIAEKYVSYLRDRNTPNEQSRLGYCTMVLIFLASLDTEIESLCIADIDKYKKIRQNDLSDNRLNDVLSRVADFFEFCITEDMDVKFQKEDVLNLRIPRSAVKENNAPRVISSDDIVAVRKTLIEKEEIRKLLTFELLYGFGLKEKDLKHFNFENYNANDGSFYYRSRTYIMPEYLQAVIKNASDKALDKYSTYGGKEIESFKNHILVAGELSGLKLKISDLSKTHDETSIKCSGCGNTYPFEDQYWMLRESPTENFRFYFPVCNHCVKGLYTHE